MIRYAITDRTQFGGTEADRRSALVAQALRLSHDGVEYLQVREKDLPFSEVAALANRLHHAVRDARGGMRLLLNASWIENGGVWPAGVGLHLSLSELDRLAHQVKSTPPLPNEVSASFHSVEELEKARLFATLLLFAPVFEKQVRNRIVRAGTGLVSLAAVCNAARPLPVLAMGGVTHENTAACLAAGAAGVAGIRLFL